MNILHAPIFPDATLELTGTFLPFKMSLDYELWQVAQRWGPGPRGDFLEIGVGWEQGSREWEARDSGLCSCFSLIGLGLWPRERRYNKQNWAVMAGEGMERKKRNYNSHMEWVQKLPHFLSTCFSLNTFDWQPLLTHQEEWMRWLCSHVEQLWLLDDWVPAHNPITVLQIQSSFVALCKDTLPSENGENLSWQRLTDSKLLMGEHGRWSF